MVDNKKEKPNYVGHRERLRKRFVENGIGALAEHEILEFVLFHTIPRVDTKIKAYSLLDKFGSLKNVFDAPIEVLVAEGLSETSAAHIRLFSEISSWMVRNSLVGGSLLKYDDMGKFFVKELAGDKNERVVATLIDNKNNVISVETICEGSFAYSKVDAKKIVELCLVKNAPKIVLAHNHPSGSITPSLADNMSTIKLDNLLSDLGIELFENYIIGGGDYVGIKKMNEVLRSSDDGRE